MRTICVYIRIYVYVSAYVHIYIYVNVFMYICIANSQMAKTKHLVPIGTNMWVCKRPFEDH